MRRTPVEPSRVLAESAGGPVWLKCENLQRTGVVQDPRRLPPHPARLDRRRASPRRRRGQRRQPRTGRRARRRLLGHAATVFMPGGRPAAQGRGDPRLRRRRAAGRRHLRRDAWPRPREFADADRGGADPPVRPPRRHRRPGHGRAGDPRAVPGRATVVVRTGGGGLLGDRGRAWPAPGCRWSARRRQATRRGRRRWPRTSRCRVRRRDHRRRHRGPAARRPDVRARARAGRRDRHRRRRRAVPGAAVLPRAGKMLVEPAGAAAVAALLEHPGRSPSPVVAVLSGGNVDPLMLGRDPPRHGRRRPLRELRVRLADRPGALATCSRCSAPRARTSWTWRTPGSPPRPSSGRSTWARSRSPEPGGARTAAPSHDDACDALREAGRTSPRTGRGADGVGGPRPVSAAERLRGHQGDLHAAAVRQRVLAGLADPRAQQGGSERRVRGDDLQVAVGALFTGTEEELLDVAGRRRSGW